jgi:hypothetical protein
MTQKAARGGDAKWKLSHLPAQTDDSFKDLLVPLAREMAGNLGPWEALPVTEVQNLVDRVYGADQYVVAEDNVWFGLVRPNHCSSSVNTTHFFILLSSLIA